jgi:hypothetical protein
MTPLEEKTVSMTFTRCITDASGRRSWTGVDIKLTPQQAQQLRHMLNFDPAPEIDVPWLILATISDCDILIATGT